MRPSATAGIIVRRGNREERGSSDTKHYAKTNRVSETRKGTWLIHG